MEDPHDDLPLDFVDLLRSRNSAIPFTRTQQVVNVTHTVKNIKETMTTITIDFTHRHRRFLRSAEGDVTTMADTAFPPLLIVTFPHSTLKGEFDDYCLWSPTERHSLIHTLLSSFNLTSDELAKLETEVSLCLFNLVSTAKDEGYNAIDVVLFIEVETVDTYDAEVVALAMRERASISVTSPAPTAPRSCPALRSSIEALFSQVFDDRNSSDMCNICLNEYSCGVTVTRLPCSHDFHRECIETWLNANNSCPMCRSPI